MEDSEEVMFDEADYEVVDECTGEEEQSPTPAEVNKQIEESAKVEPTAETESAPEKIKDPEPVQKEEENAVAIPLEPKETGEPDFTADIEMDQPETCQTSTIVPDTTCVNSSDVALDKDGDVVINEESTEDAKKTESAVEIVPPEHAWYEEKLKAKTDIFKERLSKLARVLELSYPAYKPWLEHNKTSVYHLDPPRRCPLDKPHTNRWKFICSRKTVQESTNKEEDSAEGTVNKKLETVWRLGPTDGSGVNTDNASQYPPFVMRVVKVFEEFIQSVEQSEDEEQPAAAEQVTPADTKPPLADVKSEVDVPSTEDQKSKEEPEPSTVEVKAENEITEQRTNIETTQRAERTHHWLWLLVRSNSKDELMVFATGKKISESTMQKLKQTFETGPGKDCNVKSLYCKSIDSKSEGGTTSNITFLAGTEALDEVVGGVKIQLAPKTNFWCNASGVEQLGAAVGDMLNPLQKITVMEVGCGLGLIGLMVASKCKKVIGLDAPSEVEEAEMTSELNKVENASFIMGQPNELIAKVTTLLKNTKAAAIVNGNTTLGRDIEIMTALRKIPSLRRVVMITTLTKQSVRAIMELTRPAEGDLGNPFMPLRATLVDTLPTGPHFEVVIRMERLNLQNIGEPWFWHHVKFRAGLATDEAPRKNPPNATGIQAKNAPGAKVTENQPNANRRANNRNNSKRNKAKKAKTGQWNMVHGSVTGVVRNPMVSMAKTVVVNLMSVGKPGKTSPRGKNGTLDRANVVKKEIDDKISVVSSKPTAQATKDTPASPDPLRPVKVAKSSKNQNTSVVKKNPLAKVQPARGQRLSGAQKRKRHWAMIEAQKQGVGGGPVMGGNNDQAPAEKRMRGNENRNDLRGRHGGPRLAQQVQNQQMLLNMAHQRLVGPGPMVDIGTAKQLQNMLNLVIDQTNKLQTQLPRSIWDRIAPPANNYQQQDANPSRGNNSNAFRDPYAQNMGWEDMTATTPNPEFGGNSLQPPPLPLFNRPPIDRTKIMPAGMNSAELRQQPRGISHCLQGPDFRKYQGNNWNAPANMHDKNREPAMNKNSPIPLMESIARPPSPKRSFLGTSRGGASPPRRYGQPSYPQQDKRQQSIPPPRRQSSPNRVASPSRDNNPYSEIFQRRPVATQQSKQQSSNFATREYSPPARNQGGRSSSPPKRFPNTNWDTNRGGSSQQMGNWNQRQQLQMQQEKRPATAASATNDGSTSNRRWSSNKTQNTQNWDKPPTNEPQNRQQNVNQTKRGGANKEGMWMSGGGDIWNPQQISMKPSATERQWGGNNGQGPSGDRWNPRNNDNYGHSDNRGDWRNSNNKGNRDWSDLPDDAKDPWGDDTSGKSRWQQSEQSSNPNWGRGQKKDQNWSNKSNDNWQNRNPMPMNMPKPLWPNMGNQNSNEQCWRPPNVTNKSGPTGNWQGGNNFTGNDWRPQNYSGLPQLPRQNILGLNNFKGGR